MKELQDRLAETEQRLAAERNQSSQFWDVLNGKSGQELEAAQKDLTIMFLKTQTGTFFFFEFSFLSFLLFLVNCD